ncbi:hypothetical protein MuYL_3567 [Mucilaginibacter xinganensis]|uniref:Uncharacterized protein n=1 Tax=Mucilaginibacter xinganensis TaxID=1234841 RepID=A0A223P016_9SPHI|nr:hypothetical protein MuYL_3567 [Mucilaginibacter xinganensis]
MEYLKIKAPGCGLNGNPRFNFTISPAIFTDRISVKNILENN